MSFVAYYALCFKIQMFLGIHHESVKEKRPIGYFTWNSVSRCCRPMSIFTRQRVFFRRQLRDNKYTRIISAAKMWVSACCGNASFPCDSMTLTFLFLTNWLNCFVCCCENFVRYCIRKRRQYSSASSLSFFLSVNTITHKPLHLAWWSVARKCILTTSKSLLNIKVTGQMSRSHGFFVFFFCVCMILLEPVGLDSRNVAAAWPAGST